jgi:alginate O-acetyltransferase complex protein AlgI
LRQRFVFGLEAGTVFCLICILWSFWTCQSWAEFQTLVDAASRPTLREIAIVLAGLAVICVCGMLWGRSSRETSEGRGTQEARGPFHFWRSAVAVGTGAVCLLVAPSVVSWTSPSAENVMARLHNDVLNARDMKQQRRGYYEELDVGRMDNWRWRQAEEPEGWGEGKKVFYQPRSDFLLSEIVPSVSTVLGGAPIRANSLGMRDREYEEIKPPNTYRIVLVGASHDQGTGVNEAQTYENIVEDRLNDQRPDSRYSRYEIVNMSVGGYGILQRLLRLEQQGFEFKPDAAMLSIAAADQQFLTGHLKKALNLGITPPAGYREIFEVLVRKAGIHAGMPDLMIERRLQPYLTEIYEWAFRRFAQESARCGVRPVVIYRPAPADFEGSEPAMHAEMVQLARAAGLDVIDLSSAFDSVTNHDNLVLRKWDDHTTVLGHRLLADKLYEQLVPLLFGSPSIQQTSLLQKP